MKGHEEKLMKIFWLRPAFRRHSPRSFKNGVCSASALLLLLFFFVLVVSVFVFTGRVDLANYTRYSFQKAPRISPTQSVEFPLDCATWNDTRACPRNYPVTYKPSSANPSATCPEYFRWIHEDLRHWKESGITKVMVEKAKATAHFRLIILDGKVYVERLRPSIQTRALFTLWGIAQLIRTYPGRLPDLDLMFDCDDRPVVQAKHFRQPNSAPPPLFRYCSDWRSLDIVFPDWSFWGWAETHIKPWRSELKEIKEGNKKIKWEEREPYAYWKGNPNVCPWRADLMSCNATPQTDWNTRLYVQDWVAESQHGYTRSNLGDQCTHRYKIYIEGWAWSVSEKYIFACDSAVLLMTPRWYDFFIRGMVPQQHYWPVRDNDKCKSLKYAVEWGNNHTQEAKSIGEAGSRFIHQDMTMEYVYDYMFHLFNEYGKLFKYKPVVPPAAVELCPESLACSSTGIWRHFMEDSLETKPRDSHPCSLPPRACSLVFESSRMIDRQHPRRAQSTAVFFLAILIFIGLITQWLDVSIITGSLQKKVNVQDSSYIYSEEFDCSLNCSEISPAITIDIGNATTEACPDYFRWIHEDLRPWKEAGITREMVEKAKNVAHIRITVVNGRLYTLRYKRAFQTRDTVTIWGILQLLRLYPGRLPDLDLMLECGDRPVIKKLDYGNSEASIPPPLFHYCGDESSFDIVFPDWSFWGWPELNIKPWEELKQDIQEGNRRIKWEERETYAYWKGNTKLGAARRALAKCNASDQHDWKARIFGVDWTEEKRQGFKSSDIANQCTYRYKIYVEGVTWSVSQKYILACDSMTLIIQPRFYDFFTRSLLPSIHYWPINTNKKCESIKFAVEWGNRHADKAQEIGKAGSSFVQENLVMDYVYDYSFHLLNEYAKLLKYKPIVPEGAVETCSEALVCDVKGQKKRYRVHSMVKSSSGSPPCDLPPSFGLEDVSLFLERKENLTNQVVLWERSETESS
ncbi:downstream target of AGL15 2 [Perilla frutescens var. frutescens]|nr:downstream target of AGL15 2 [Perilla frutescens var. frutescens]